MSLTRLLPLLLAGAVLGLSGGGPFGDSAKAGPSGQTASGQEVEVVTDIGGARAMAQRALAVGRADLAVSIARQIIAVAPQDAAAHMLLAAGLTRSGQPDQAVAVAKAGFRLAEGDAARFEGAWLTAEALAGSGRTWASKLWLRRADLYATTKAHEAVLAQAYGTVSAQTRLSFSAQAFAGPSENVNGGSLHDTFWFYGIPIPIDEALPGFVWGGAVQAAWAFSPRTQGRLQWAHKEVSLGDRAAAINPAAKGSDYRQDEVTLGLSHLWASDNGRMALALDAAAGRRWTGGDHSADRMAVSAELRRALSEDWIIAGQWSAEDVDVTGRPVADSLTQRLGFSVSHRAEGLGALTARLGAVEVASDAAGVAWRGPSLALGWRAPIRSEHLGLTVDLEAERRDYWKTPGFAPDDWMSLSVTAELPSLAVMGFNPTVTVTAARTKSEVVVRDTEELGISFGIASRF